MRVRPMHDSPAYCKLLNLEFCFRLIQHLVPGMIRKVNKIRSPFAWRVSFTYMQQSVWAALTSWCAGRGSYLMLKFVAHRYNWHARNA